MVKATNSKKTFGRRMHEFLINVCLLAISLCLIMLFMIMCNKYSASQYEVDIAKDNKSISNYKLLTEKYKSESALIHKQAEEAHLKAFLHCYGGEE